MTRTCMHAGTIVSTCQYKFIKYINLFLLVRDNWKEVCDMSKPLVHSSLFGETTCILYCIYPEEVDQALDAAKIIFIKLTLHGYYEY